MGAIARLKGTVRSAGKWTPRHVAGIGAIAVAPALLMATVAGSAGNAGAIASNAHHRHMAATSQAARFISTLRPYVSRNADGTIKLAVPWSVARHLRADWLSKTESSIAVLNTRIRDGQLRSTSGDRVYSRRASTYTIQGGFTGGPYYEWWGLEWYISDYDTHRIVQIWLGGGGVAAVQAFVAAAFEVAPEVAGAVAVVLVAIAGILDACDAGNGVIVYQPSVGPPWCGSQ